MLVSIILSIFSIVPALIFGVYFLNFCIKRISLISKGQETMGNIIDWSYHGYFNSKNIDFYYAPMVKFFDDKNTEHVFESNYRTSLGKIWSNIRFSDNKVKVIYNKENPNECEINSFSALWGAAVTPFLLTLVFAFVAILAVKDLFVVNMSLDKLFEINFDQLMICIMLLVLFVGILLLWDLFNDGPKNRK